MTALTEKTLKQTESAIEALRNGVQLVLEVGEKQAIAFQRQEKTIEGKIASAKSLIAQLQDSEIAIALGFLPEVGMGELTVEADTLLKVLSNGLEEENKALAKIQKAKEAAPEYKVWKMTKTAIFNANKSKVERLVSEANKANITKLVEVKKAGGWRLFVDGTRDEAIKTAKEACYKMVAEGTKPTRIQIHNALADVAVTMLENKYQRNVQVGPVMYAVPSFAEICKELVDLWDSTK